MSRLRRAAPCLLLALAVLGGPRSSRAQSGTEARALALFREGHDALERGDVETACAKLAESLSVMRAAGTLFNLAQCEEQRHDLIAARKNWEGGVAMVDAKDPRAALARERIRELDRRIPRLAIRLAEGSPAGVKVTLDGAEIAPTMLGAASPMALGEHVVVVVPPGAKEGQTTRVTLQEGERKEIVVAATGAPVVTDSARAAAPVSTAPAGMTTRRSVGLVVASVGVAALAGFGVTGVMVLDRKSIVATDCPGTTCTTKSGYDAAQSGKTLVVVNAVLFGAGVAGAGVGAYLIVSGGREEPRAAVSMSLAPDAAGLIYRHSF